MALICTIQTLTNNVFHTEVGLIKHNFKMYRSRFEEGRLQNELKSQSTKTTSKQDELHKGVLLASKKSLRIFCNFHSETMDHLFLLCNFSYNVRITFIFRA
ncbi:unnamed protein product [Lupinus luteus]|uniref:Uncharacterized protein n=1 Tax=Lupinus luteus TaxID=3873 RepID=A0AAV1WAZ1_LUPLU